MYQRLSSMPQEQDGDTVAILLDRFDPPCMDHRRVVEKLVSRPNASHIWLAPVPSETKAEQVRDMVTAFCAELTQSLGKPLTYYGIGLDRGWDQGLQIVEFARKYPAMKFVPVLLDPPPGNLPTTIGRPLLARFHGEPSVPELETLGLRQLFAVRGGMHERLRAGIDESRNITATVWGLIQSRRLYR